MENYTEQLCGFAEKLKYEDLPVYIVEQTKKFIADFYASSFAGYKINQKFNLAVLEVIKEKGGTEQASILFEKKRYPVSSAAFMNAIYAHGADMDDGNRKSAGHIGTHVMPAVFAMAERLNITWKEVIVAINVGYEFFNRIAGAAQPSLYNKGFHSTGIAGAIACGAACAKLMGQDMKSIYNSVSLAAIQSSGLIIIDESGQGCKPINPANAARIGVDSALIADKGVVSSRNPLESGKGWFYTFADSVDSSILLDGLGHDFTIGESYLKLYPTCRHTHSCIDAALEIRKELNKQKYFRCEELEKINVYIYPSAIKSAGYISHPKDVNEAKFSIKYALATAFCRGGFKLIDLNVERENHEINALIDKISLFSDNSLEDRKAGIRGTRVMVKLKSGNVLERVVLIPKGEGNTSLEWDDLKQKMRNCIGENDSEAFSNQVLTLCKNIWVENRFHSLTATINNLINKEDTK